MLQLTEIMVKAKEREQLIKMLFFLSHIFGLQILQTDGYKANHINLAVTVTFIITYGTQIVLDLPHLHDLS